MVKGILFLAVSFIPTIAGAQNAERPADGVWQAVDGQRILKVENNRIQIYETAGNNCIDAGIAKRRSKSKQGETVFSGEGLPDIHLRSDARAHLVLSGLDHHETKLAQLPALPAACGNTPNTPVANYDIFWQTFSEMYPFFDQRKIYWPGIDKQFRPRVTAATSPTELFDIFQKMIEALHDVATEVNAKDLRRHFAGAPEKQNPPRDEKLAQQSLETIRKQYIRGELRGYCHLLELGPKTASASPLHAGALIHFGMLDKSIGYLRIDEIPQFCQTEFDHAFKASAELKGLIVDARFASNGDLAAAIRLASRFTGKDYVGFSRVRGSTSEDEIVPRSSRPGFTGRVAVLTGRDSGIAVELFALALIGREPPVARVGGPTRGAIAETIWRTLPNGWSFRLPVSKYLAQNGSDYHFVGLPPDVAAPPFSANDAAANHDLTLEKGIETLKQSSKNR